MSGTLPFLLFLALFLLLWGAAYALLPLLGRLLRRTASWTVRRAERFPRVASFRKRRQTSPWIGYLPVALLLVCGLAFTMVAGDAVLDLGEMIHDQSPQLQRVDTGIHDWAIGRRTAAATSFFRAVTFAGSPGSVTVLATLAGLALAFRRRLRWAAYILGTNGGGALLEIQLKAHFARARPDVAAQMMAARGFAFPSGHSMGTAVLMLSLLYLAMRALPRWRFKAGALAFALLFISAVALSRVYLGVHWLSDVAAGITVAAVWVVVTTVAYETFRRIRRLRRARAALTAA